MKWNGFGIKIDKSMTDKNFKVENLASERPYGNTVELVELCGWHDPKYWRNCIQCVVRKKKTTLSKKKLDDLTKMTTLPTNDQLLLETKEAFSIVRGSVVLAMQKLHQVHESDAWSGVCSSWSEYVESELHISQSFASKLLSVNKHYLIDGGLSPENISGIAAESLYLAIRTGGTTDEQLSRARTLNRSELRAEANEKTPCNPHKQITICGTCGVRIYEGDTTHTG